MKGALSAHPLKSKLYCWSWGGQGWGRLFSILLVLPRRKGLTNASSSFLILLNSPTLLSRLATLSVALSKAWKISSGTTSPGPSNCITSPSRVLCLCLAIEGSQITHRSDLVISTNSSAVPCVFATALSQFHCTYLSCMSAPQGVLFLVLLYGSSRSTLERIRLVGRSMDSAWLMFCLSAC